MNDETGGIVVSGGAEAQPASTTPPPVEPIAQPSSVTEGEVQSQEQDLGEGASPKQPGKARLQKRFSEMTRTIHEERARREAVERELAELRQGAAPKPPATGGEAAPKLEDFQDYEAYAESRARWVAREEMRRASLAAQQKRVATQANEAAIAIRAKWETNEDSVREKFVDYDEVMADTGVGFTEAMSIAILDSDIGPEIAYYLKKNPEEARKLHGLTPVAAARAIGKLETKLTTAPPPPPISNTPPPPKPLAGSTPSTGLRDDEPLEQWIAKRNKQVAERKRM